MKPKTMIKNLILILLWLTPACVSAQEIDLLILNDEYDKALQTIDQKLATDTVQPLLYLKKGIVQQKMFDFAGAIKSLEKAYQLDSLNPNILNEVAEVNGNLGNHKKALPYFKALYHNDTLNSVKVLKLVRGYLNLRMYKEPLEILESAYKRDSTNFLINKQLALCEARTGHNDLAISLFRKVIEQNPSDLANYFNLSSVYQSMKQDIKVIETLEKGLQFFPDEPQLLLKLGDFQFHAKKYAKAIIHYEKYIALEDSSLSVMKNLGLCYFFEIHTKEALNLLEKSLNANPDDDIAALYVGLCYKQSGNLKKSLEYLNIAAKSAVPTYLTDIYCHLGYVYNLNLEYKKAIPAFKKAYELDPTKCDILLQIAIAYENIQNSKAMAIKYYDAYLKSAKELNSNNPKLREYALYRKRELKK